MFWILTRDEFARSWLNFEVFDDAAAELNILRLAGDFVEIVGEVHAQAGGKDRAFDKAPEFARIVEN